MQICSTPPTPRGTTANYRPCDDDDDDEGPKLLIIAA